MDAIEQGFLQALYEAGDSGFSRSERMTFLAPSFLDFLRTITP